MRVALCDDDSYVLDSLEKFLNKYEDDSGIKFSRIRFNDGNELVFYAEDPQDLDIIILDIKMPKINGLTAAEKIRQIDKKVKIIFLTSLAQYSTKGYTFNAHDFLVKPLKYISFKETMDRAVQLINEEDNKYLLEKNDSGIYKIYFNDIIFIETYKRNTMIHTSEKEVLSYKTLKGHEEILDKRFFRCHAAYLINLEKIIEIQAKDILLSGGPVISYSKYKKKKLMSEMTLFYGSKI